MGDLRDYEAVAAWDNGEGARRLGWRSEDDAEAFADAVEPDGHGTGGAVPRQGASVTEPGHGRS